MESPDHNQKVSRIIGTGAGSKAKLTSVSNVEMLGQFSFLPNHESISKKSDSDHISKVKLT